MDPFVQQLIELAPSLAVLVYVIWRQGKSIDRLIDVCLSNMGDCPENASEKSPERA